MNRLVLIVLSLALVAVGCSDDGGAPTSTTFDPTIETSGPGVGPTDCLEIWTEALVKSIAGDEYTFDQTNPEKTICVFAGPIDGIVVSYRPGERAEYEKGKGEASLQAPAIEVDLCDRGYYIELVEAFVLMEAYSEANGRVYGASVGGVGLEAGRELAKTLIATACGQG